MKPHNFARLPEIYPLSKAIQKVFAKLETYKKYYINDDPSEYPSWDEPTFKEFKQYSDLYLRLVTRFKDKYLQYLNNGKGKTISN